MCGIVGFTGKQNAAPILLDGLKKLEYRGYDSAGIAVAAELRISAKKQKTEKTCRASLVSATPGGQLTARPQTPMLTPT